MTSGAANSAPCDPGRRGYSVLYHSGQANRCPGCGRSHWYVGRLSAECGFCATALPLAETGTVGAGLFRRGMGRGRIPIAAAA